MNLMDLDSIDALLQRPSVLRQQIGDRLHIHNSRQPIFTMEGLDMAAASAVLFLLGRLPEKTNHPEETCLILNKRSADVRQAGDLCCPGGRVSPRLDAGLAKLLRLPMLPLARWPFWPDWRKQRPHNARWLRLMLCNRFARKRGGNAPESLWSKVYRSLTAAASGHVSTGYLSDGDLGHPAKTVLSELGS